MDFFNIPLNISNYCQAAQNDKGYQAYLDKFDAEGTPPDSPEIKDYWDWLRAERDAAIAECRRRKGIEQDVAHWRERAEDAEAELATLRAELDIACHIKAEDKVGFDFAVLRQLTDLAWYKRDAENLYRQLNLALNEMTGNPAPGPKTALLAAIGAALAAHAAGPENEDR